MDMRMRVERLAPLEVRPDTRYPDRGGHVMKRLKRDFENKKPKSFSNATSEVRALLNNTRRSARTSAENGTNASQKVFQSKIFVHADARRMISAIDYCMSARKQSA